MKINNKKENLTMKRWKCTDPDCVHGCVAETESDISPTVCLHFGTRKRWEPYKPTTNSNQLPKLTAEVFDRPDCPEWAKYAAVDSDGDARYHERYPRLSKYWWSSDGDIKDVNYGKFDASDWKNSLIERPANKPELPDWCKVGEWIYTSSEQYLKIEGISIDLQKIELSNGATWSNQDIIDEAVPARLRPYNADEIPKLPFEVSEINSDFRTIVESCKGDKIWLAGASTAISTEELMRDFHYEGFPCGVLEHRENGEWVQ